MRKWFIFSDCHGFYKELTIALRRKGFDISNPEHCIIFCGDALDRGKEPTEVYRFLRSIPKDRRVLIRGNHEALMRDLLMRGYPEDHDVHNGTLDTLYAMAGLVSKSEVDHRYYKEVEEAIGKGGTDAWAEVREKYHAIRSGIYGGTAKEFIDWVYSDEWVNYHETDKHIFVHSFIPVHQEYTTDKWGFTYPVGNPSPRDDWRDADEAEWESAMWGNPWKKAKLGLNATGKTIVCGHWHTSDFYNNLSGNRLKELKSIEDNPIFRSKRYKLIGLDACTALSKRVNVLTLMEDEL